MNKILFFLSCLVITGCVKNNTSLGLSPDELIIFPNGSVFGGASDQQATELAKIMVNAHQKTIEKLSQKDTTLKEVAQNHAAQVKTAQQSLKLLEKISNRQGSGEISLFFKRKSAALYEDSLEYDRLIHFLDYLVRESHGRKVLLVCIGSSSGRNDDSNNIEVSIARSRAPVDAIEKYLINTPHKIYEAYGIGDSKNESGKPLTFKQEERYQHVRIITAFEDADLPLLPR